MRGWGIVASSHDVAKSCYQFRTGSKQFFVVMERQLREDFLPFRGKRK
jgi:hypothetical protein